MTEQEPSTEKLWQEYCEAAQSTGELPGGVEEFDIDEMNNRAWDLYEHAKALSQQLEKAREVKALVWSEERKPDGGEASYYTHVVAQSPLGEILIEWKGWKDHDSPTCHLPWGEFICGDDLADCKAKVHDAFQHRYNAMSAQEY